MDGLKLTFEYICRSARLSQSVVLYCEKTGCTHTWSEKGLNVMMEIISRTKKDLAPALIDNRGLAEGGVDTGEERAVAHWRVATKEHLTLGGWAENICSDERKYLEIGSLGNAITSGMLSRRLEILS